jgi:protein-L-isoaspartate(D-aspartate) O-methyltransferase
MVREALVKHNIKDQRVLAAMQRVPRHLFVPEASRREAYQNRPLLIGYGQTISQPYIVAAMSEAAAPQVGERCLEIGTGSGYQAAVLAELCARVYSIEYLEGVYAFGRANLQRLGYTEQKVVLRHGDGYLGWPEAAPFDAILVTAAPDHVPKALLEQLALGGRLVIPVGAEGSVQRLERWTRRTEGMAEGAFEREELMGVRFVPFLGQGSEKPAQ